MPKKKNAVRADGRISVQVYLGRGADGKRKYKAVYGRTQKEADEKALQIRPCLINGNMHNGEQFFRQTRQIFAGIIALFQENLTQSGGKRAVIGHIDIYQTRPKLSMKKGLDITAERDTFGDWAERWIKIKAIEVSKSQLSR